MSDLEQRLAEDKALRDAALALFKADLALVRADLEERGIGERIGSRLGESTMDLLDDGIDYAEENKGKVATGIAAMCCGSRADRSSTPSRVSSESTRMTRNPPTATAVPDTIDPASGS